MRLCIVGAGPGGYVAAIKAAQLGAEVTIIEADEVGGTCLNHGCIPTKTLLASAEAYALAKDLDSFGIELQGTVSPNMQKIIERKNLVVSTQVKGIRGLFKSYGVTLKEGRGRFISGKEVEVTAKDGSTSVIAADKFIIATGSRPAQIPIFPFDGKYIISSTDALNLKTVPKSILIVGAGVIGCEFACIFRELGAEVNIVELLPRAVATEDEEVSALLERELKKKKIKLYTGVKVENVTVADNAVTAKLSGGKELKADIALVSIGRAFNTDNLGLDAASVNMGKRGNVEIDEYLQTSNPDIYAIGDVTGGILLAHVASKEGIIAAKNVMGGRHKIDLTTVPAAIFTTPEIASVGLRQHQAVEQGKNFKTGMFQYRGLGKAHAMGEISGFFKIISDAADDKILGVHIIGAHASDIIHEAAVAIRNGITTRGLAETIHAHPTLSEGLMEAGEDLHDEAIHVPKK